MFLTIVLFLVGLVLIIKGGDVFVDAASWMAEKTGIPKLIIGATVVSLATTLPEMLVSFFAAAEGKVDMAIGNAMGSVTVNIGLVMGIALICMPAAIKRKDYLLKSILMLSAAFVVAIFGLTGSIGLFPSIILLVIFIVAMYDNIRRAKVGMRKNSKDNFQSDLGDSKSDIQNQVDFASASGVCSPNTTATLTTNPEITRTTKNDVIINILKFVLGAVAIVLGSRLLVDNGSEIARILGVPERIIAVSVIAIGTSLPELVTTIAAISKKQCSLSIGNILGANIFDLTLILPISALISGKALPVSNQFAYVDLPFCFIIGAVALIPSLITKKFHRAQGVLMVALYLTYLVFTTVIL